MPLHRLEDWQERLTDFLPDRLKMPFIKGENDCLLFAADAVRVMTGVDLAAPWRGKYKTAIEGARLILKYGGGNLRDAMRRVAAEHGIETIPPRLARLGDVSLIWGTAGAGLCLVLGATAIHIQATGPYEFETIQSDTAWLIG